MQGRSASLVRLFDQGVGVLASLWPRSMVAREAGRLARSGYAIGEVHDVQFSVSLTSDSAEDLLRELRAAGFAMREHNVEKSCCIVSRRMPLRAYDLHVTTVRLQRLVGSAGGFAELVGPVPVMAGRCLAVEAHEVQGALGLSSAAD